MGSPVTISEVITVLKKVQQLHEEYQKAEVETNEVQHTLHQLVGILGDREQSRKLAESRVHSSFRELLEDIGHVVEQFVQSRTTCGGKSMMWVASAWGAGAKGHRRNLHRLDGKLKTQLRMVEVEALQMAAVQSERTAEHTSQVAGHTSNIADHLTGEALEIQHREAKDFWRKQFSNERETTWEVLLSAILAEYGDVLKKTFWERTAQVLSTIHMVLDSDLNGTISVQEYNRFCVTSFKESIPLLFQPGDSSGHATVLMTGHCSQITVMTSYREWLLTGDSTGHLKAWNTMYPAGMRLESSLTAHTTGITAIAVGRRQAHETFSVPVVFTASQDSTIRAWDIYIQECRGVLRHHTLPPAVLATPEEGDLLFSGGQGGDHEIRIWDTTHHTLLALLYGHTSAISALTSLGAGYLLSASNDYSAKVYSLKELECVKTITDWGRLCRLVNLVVHKEDNAVYGTCADATVVKWGLESLLDPEANSVASVVHEAPRGWIRAVRFCPQTGIMCRVVSREPDVTLEVRMKTSSLAVVVDEPTHAAPVNLADGRPGIVLGDADGGLSVYEIGNGTLRHTQHITGRGWWTNHVQLDLEPSGKYWRALLGNVSGGNLYTVCGGTVVKMWDLASTSGSLLNSWSLECNPPLQSSVAAFVVVGSNLWTGTLDGRVQKWDVGDAGPTFSSECSRTFDAVVSLACCGEWLYVGTTKEQNVWGQDGLVTVVDKHNLGVHKVVIPAWTYNWSSLKAAPPGAGTRLLAAVAYTGVVYDVRKDGDLRQVAVVEHRAPVACFETHVVAEDEWYLFTGSYDYTVKVARMGGSGATEPVTLRPFWEGITALSVCGGSLLACGMSDGAIAVWDWRQSQHVMDLVGHTGRIQFLVRAPTALLSGSLDRTIKAWGSTLLQQWDVDVADTSKLPGATGGSVIVLPAT